MRQAQRHPVSPQGDTIQVKGYTLRYQQMGQGKPLVLLHGLGLMGDTWLEAMDHLKDRYRVIALDLLGFGYSDQPEIRYTLEDQVAFVVAFLDELGLKKVYLGGQGSGSMIALRVMERHPERVIAGVLSGAGGLNRRYPWWLRLLRARYVGDFISLLLGQRQLKDYLQRQYFDQTQVTDALAARFAAPFARSYLKDVLVQSLRSYDEWPAVEQAPRVACPVLVLWGEQDRLHPAQEGEILAQALPQGELQVVPNCGRLVHAEKPQLFAQRVEAFLRKLEEPQAHKVLPFTRRRYA
ncbi:MAG: alpha/beta fold hydrolase [Christensenellales bacterium]